HRNTAYSSNSSLAICWSPGGWRTDFDQRVGGFSRDSLARKIAPRAIATHWNAFQAARPSCGAAGWLIIGASRGIGLEPVKAALQAGHSVCALARSARRIRVEHPQLEKMAGDALEMATMKRALTGIFR